MNNNIRPFSKPKNIVKYGIKKFRRLKGVKKETFEKMVEIVVEAHRIKKPEKKNKLSVEKTVLMMLEYLREYRTYFHIAKNRI